MAEIRNVLKLQANNTKNTNFLFYWAENAKDFLFKVIILTHKN